MDTSPFVRYFQRPEHRPFSLPGGEPAALLVHGFPGSPAEMRPLGEALNRVGWTAQGILLPGFGEQIETLFERRYTDWVSAVQRALDDLRREHCPILLVGFSMGAAVCLQVAVDRIPDGLALLAPYWKLSGALWSLLPVLRHVFPMIHPFRLIKVDWNDPEFRKGIADFMPELNLDDPEVQRGIRNFAVPIGVIDEIRQAGLAAWQAAPRANLPTLVLQGAHDELVQVELTRRLLQRLPGRLQYQELIAAHDLLAPGKPAWPRVEQAVLQFAQELALGENRC